MKIKKMLAVLASAAMLIGAVTSGASAEEASENTVAAAESSDMVRSFLTGKTVPASVGRTRPVAIMLNNIEAALPQSGIGNAAVVYEAPVEGSITRLLGIFEDYQDVERIGSVRSCRDYYIYMAREFDAIYLHYGQAVYALDLLNTSAVLNLSGLDAEGETTYYRSSDFVAPHNVFTNYDLIQAGIAYKGYSTDYSDGYLATGHYQFAGDGEIVTLENGVPATTVTPGGYTYNNAYFVYDESTGQYTRYQFGDVQIDGQTGKALTYDNIILQYCSWEAYDENGYLNIDMISGGAGKYITKGKAIDITWSKDSINPSDKYAEENFGVTHYYDSNGEEITLNQGKTWVCIILNSYSDNVSIS